MAGEFLSVEEVRVRREASAKWWIEGERGRREEGEGGGRGMPPLQSDVLLPPP
jgi:hypothetical protein